MSDISRFKRYMVGAVTAFLLAVGGVVNTPVVASAAASYPISWTEIGIYPRASTSMDSAKVGSVLYDGTSVLIVCEARGQLVSDGFTSDIWERLADGTFVPNIYVNTGVDGWTPGIPRCDETQQADRSGTATSSATTSDLPVARSSADPCFVRYGATGFSSTSVVGGWQRDWDRNGSLYQVCEGWGAPEAVEFSPEMKCAVISAAATYGGPPLSYSVSRACDIAGVSHALWVTKDWKGLAAGQVCGYFSELFAGVAGVYAAGATAETGPGAVAVGLATYRNLSAFLKLACGGLLDGGARTLGEQIETNHESHVALDIVRDGKCLREQNVWGVIRWSAANC